jgi:hypothetical protein
VVGGCFFVRFEQPPDLARASTDARRATTTTTTTMRAKMNLRACSTPSGATREARAMKIIARAGEEEVR